MKNSVCGFLLLFSFLFAFHPFDLQAKDSFTLDYNNLSNFNFIGNAAAKNNKVFINFSEESVKGSVWYKPLVHLSKGFETEFSFSVEDPESIGTPDDSYVGADGFAFVIQTSSDTAIGTSCGNIGYQGLYNALVVEFDMYKDTKECYLDFQDPNGNHVAVQSAKNSFITPEHISPFLVAINPNIDIKPDGTLYYGKILYDSELHIFEVYYSLNNTFTTPVIHIDNFNIDDYIALDSDKGYIGFTSSTGWGWESHIIHDWNFNGESSVCDSSQFNYSDFSDIDGLHFVENDHKITNYIQMTDSKLIQRSALWRDNYVPVVAGFSTEFSFRTHDGFNGESKDESLPGADGIAFVIQNQNIDACGNEGGGIGYDGIKNAVAIEFDLFSNDSTQIENYNDPNGNHLAVQVSPFDALSPIHSSKNTLAITENIPLIKNDSTVYYGKINYDFTNSKLYIYIEDKPVFNTPRLVVDNFRLSNYMNLYKGGYAYVGFTAATGSSYQNQDLMSWSFCPNSLTLISDVSTNLSDDNISRIAPNPTVSNAELYYYSENGGYCNIEVFDVLGNKVLNQSLGNCSIGMNKFNLNCSAWDKGIYFVKLEPLSSNIQFLKLVVNK